jgi:hypothetical protein
MMNCRQCRVALGDKGWIAETEKGEAGPYASEDTALRVAVAEVMRLRRAGRAARIALRNAQGDLRDICLCAMVNAPSLMDVERKRNCPFLPDIIDIADV